MRHQLGVRWSESRNELPETPVIDNTEGDAASKKENGQEVCNDHRLGNAARVTLNVRSEDQLALAIVLLAGRYGIDGFFMSFGERAVILGAERALALGLGLLEPFLRKGGTA
jgi:hypothetical protein